MSRLGFRRSYLELRQLDATAWQAGDVALVDNFAGMHGRRAFESTRRVMASLVAAGA